MKRFLLSLVAFAFVATFTSAQAQRIGSLAEVEKGNADFLVVGMIGMIDNMRKDTPKYQALTTMLKNNLMVFNTKKGSVCVVLNFPRKNMDSPSMQQTYAMVFGYAFTQGLVKMKDDTQLLILGAPQPDGTVYDYFFPQSTILAMLNGSIAMPDFEKQVEIGTGSVEDE
jgi:hypothetical protein